MPETGTTNRGTTMSTASEQDKTLKKTAKTARPSAEPKVRATKAAKADKPAAEPKAKVTKAAKSARADKPAAEPKAKAAKATRSAKADKPAAEPKAKAKAAKTSKADKPVAESKAKAGGKSRAKVAQVFAEPSKGVEEKYKEITLLNEKERYEMMSLLQKQNPNPKSELEFSNTFELLCAVVLSAQATDASVNKATPALFAKAPDARSMAALGADGIAPFIQSIGLWKNKAKFLAQLSAVLVDKYDGQVPDNFDELTALPGVGSKTARVVLNVAFGQPFIAVDTHVFRVATRTGLCIGKCPGQVEERIAPLVAEPFLKEAHHYLLLHGRYNCTARNFEGHCEKCVIAKYCKHNYEH